MQCPSSSTSFIIGFLLLVARNARSLSTPRFFSIILFKIKFDFDKKNIHTDSSNRGTITTAFHEARAGYWFRIDPKKRLQVINIVIFFTAID